MKGMIWDHTGQNNRDGCRAVIMESWITTRENALKNRWAWRMFLRVDKDVTLLRTGYCLRLMDSSTALEKKNKKPKT